MDQLALNQMGVGLVVLYLCTGVIVDGRRIGRNSEFPEILDIILIWRQSREYVCWGFPLVSVQFTHGKYHFLQEITIVRLNPPTAYLFERPLIKSSVFEVVQFRVIDQ
jgi:hypothetical protein